MNQVTMTSMNIWASLKRFDAYAKPLEDFRIRTRSGGILTVVSGLVMIFLFARWDINFKDFAIFLFFKHSSISVKYETTFNHK